MLRKLTKRLTAAVAATALLALLACVPALAAGKSPHHVVTAFDPGAGRAELEIYAPVVEEYAYETFWISGWPDGAIPGRASFEIRYADGTVKDMTAGKPAVDEAGKTWSWRIPATEKPCLSVRFTYEITNLDAAVGEIDAVIETVPGDAVSSVGPLRAYVPGHANDAASGTLCVSLTISAIATCAVAWLIGWDGRHAAKPGRRTKRRRRGAGPLK